MLKKQAIIGKELEYNFNDQELIQLSAHLANLIGEKANLENEKAKKTKEYRLAIDEKADLIHSVAKAIEKKYELRTVECTVFYESPGNEVVLKRNDTGEEVQRRPMTADEYQIQFSEIAEDFKESDNAK